MRFGIIGKGAIGRYVRDALLSRGHEVRALLLRPESARDSDADAKGATLVASVEALPGDIEHMIDCAGHAALRVYGPGILRRGIDLTTVSIGALADKSLYQQLTESAAEGSSKLHLASGAIGALDALLAARVGELHSVTYSGRKPPGGWRGSPAETTLDLDNLSEAAAHFEGNARDAAMTYPKNSNVAAAVALAGVGFEKTTVNLIADPNIGENIHEIHTTGDFGRFSFEIAGKALPDNPRSSALAAMSVVSKLEQELRRISF